MEEIIGTLEREFSSLNARFKVISVSHLEELKEDILESVQEAKIGDRLYDRYLSNFQFRNPDELPSARNIIIISVPQGMTLVNFKYRGKDNHVIIPPTYIYSRIRNDCSDILSGVLRRNGYDFASALLPYKLLVTRSGLGKYGRNNITYVEGRGSFHRLQAYFTDCPFNMDNWQKKEVMEDCRDCRACIDICPTKAILEDRFLISAETCLTFFNENEWEIPDWIDPRSHNSLVGCMKCQLICPVNRSFLQMRETGEVFSEEETENILKGMPLNELREDTVNRLKRLNMDEYYELIPRNLLLLFGKHE
jgi:epoxyqueuosine reductase